MPINFEKFVRPAQSPDIRPRRQSTSAGTSKDAIITLKIDLAGGDGSGGHNVQILNGAFSSTTSFYCEAYTNERKTL
jgi:hypothetical protein